MTSPGSQCVVMAQPGLVARMSLSLSPPPLLGERTHLDLAGVQWGRQVCVKTGLPWEPENHVLTVSAQRPGLPGQRPWGSDLMACSQLGSRCGGSRILALGVSRLGVQR